MSRLPTEPLAPMQVLFRGLELGAASFSKLFMGTTLVGFIALLPTLDMAMRMGNTPVTPEQAVALLGGRWLLMQLVTLVLGVLVQAFVITRLDVLARGAAVDTGTEWRSSLRVWLPLLLTLLLCLGILIVVCIMGAVAGLVAGLLTTLLAGKAAFVVGFVAGMLAVLVFVAIYLIFVQFIVILDRSPPAESINLSFNLVHGHWWDTFLPLLMVFVLAVGVSMICVVPLVASGELAAFGNGEETGRSLLERGVLEMVASAVFGPFLLSVVYLQFHNLKLQRPPAA